MTRVEHVEILVEEPSAEAALRSLLPRVLGDTTFRIITHTSKDQLLKRLPGLLLGYASWLPDTYRIVVLVDRDGDDCMELKTSLEQVAANAGLRSRTRSPSKFQLVNRVVVEELEAWFFGDWTAVRDAFPRARKAVPRDKRYRHPDAILGGTWEALERELQQVGYFPTGLRKIEAARAIGKWMEPDRNTSPSFVAFRDVLLTMARPATAGPGH